MPTQQTLNRLFQGRICPWCGKPVAHEERATLIEIGPANVRAKRTQTLFRYRLCHLTCAIWADPMRLFSPREREIASVLLSERSPTRIAVLMRHSLSWVNGNLRRMQRKVGGTNSARIVVYVRNAKPVELLK